MLKSAGIARLVDIELGYQGQTFNRMPGMTAGFEAHVPFDQDTSYSTVDTEVQFFAANAYVKLGGQDGMQVSVPGGLVVKNTSLNLVPVDILDAMLSVSCVGITQAATVTNAAPVAVTAAAAALASLMQRRRY